jgi:hypothetical protein
MFTFYLVRKMLIEHEINQRTIKSINNHQSNIFWAIFFLHHPTHYCLGFKLQAIMKIKWWEIES